MPVTWPVPSTAMDLRRSNSNLETDDVIGIHDERLREIDGCARSRQRDRRNVVLFDVLIVGGSADSSEDLEHSNSRSADSPA